MNKFFWRDIHEFYDENGELYLVTIAYYIKKFNFFIRCIDIKRSSDKDE